MFRRPLLNGLIKVSLNNGIDFLMVGAGFIRNYMTRNDNCSPWNLFNLKDIYRFLIEKFYKMHMVLYVIGEDLCQQLFLTLHHLFVVIDMGEYKHILLL